MAARFSLHHSYLRAHWSPPWRAASAGSANRNFGAQYVASVLAGILAAVHFRDGLDVEAIDALELVDVPGPSRPGIVDRRAASGAGTNQLAQGPGVAPGRCDGANVLALGDVEGDAASALGVDSPWRRAGALGGNGEQVGGAHRRSTKLVLTNSATIRAMGTLTPYCRTILFVAYAINSGSGDGSRLECPLAGGGNFWHIRHCRLAL